MCVFLCAFVYVCACVFINVYIYVFVCTVMCDTCGKVKKNGRISLSCLIATESIVFRSGIRRKSCTFYLGSVCSGGTSWFVLMKAISFKWHVHTFTSWFL